MTAPERELLLLLALAAKDLLREMNGEREHIFQVHAELIETQLRNFKKTAQRGNKK